MLYVMRIDGWIDGWLEVVVVNLRGSQTKLNEGIRIMHAIGRILYACPSTITVSAGYAGCYMIMIDEYF
jgi:hypothetical protein